jgi:hypothetical protein
MRAILAMAKGYVTDRPMSKNKYDVPKIPGFHFVPLGYMPGYEPLGATAVLGLGPEILPRQPAPF